MSKQDIEQILTGQRPTTTDTAIWNMYWERQGQPWRTQPEIDAERQEYLGQRRHRLLTENKLIAPLQDVPLSRADIEWLLATHEHGRGPVDWSDPEQRTRKGLYLCRTDLRGVDLSNLPLANTDLGGARLEGATHSSAHLENANLGYAHLEDALLFDAHLEGSNLIGSHVEGAMLKHAHLEGADLMGCFLDAQTNLNGVTLSSREKGTVVLADVHWGDVNLAVVDWSALSILGDESATLHPSGDYATPKFKLEILKRATRAYRQLSVVLRNQGLNEEASRFAYRAKLMQRKVYWYQRKFLSFFGSLFLDGLSGYGYRFWHSFIAYAFVIGVFAAIYYHIGPHLAWYESIVISMTAFHGRGFFPTQFNPGDPQAIAAAIEAFVGLLIEVTLIATLTQRLFGK